MISHIAQSFHELWKSSPSGIKNKGRTSRNRISIVSTHLCASGTWSWICWWSFRPGCLRQYISTKAGPISRPRQRKICIFFCGMAIVSFGLSGWFPRYWYPAYRNFASDDLGGSRYAIFLIAEYLAESRRTGFVQIRDITESIYRSEWNSLLPRVSPNLKVFIEAKGYSWYAWFDRLIGYLRIHF